MTVGLPLSDIVNVQVTLDPTAAATRNFGALLILGDSGKIPDANGAVLFSDLASVGETFATTDPEYLAATIFFAQSPQPSTLYIANYTKPAGNITATATATVSDGAVTGFTITNGGTGYTSAPNVTITGSGTGATATATISNGSVTSITIVNGGTGYTSAPTVRIDAPPSDSDTAGLTQRVNDLSSASGDWYGLALAMKTPPANAGIVQIAQMIEAYNPPRTMWVTTQEIGAVQADSTNDLAYLMNQANVSRTWVQYSTSSPYAAVSAFARIATVDYTGINTTLTLKFKDEPDVASETLTSAQAAALDAKKCNVFAKYQNGYSIIIQGYMADGTWADTRIGVDAYQNALQTAGFNLLTSMPKIPQTDAGMTTIKATYDQVSQTYVRNGLFAPGIWDGPAFGALKTGATLNDGYYIYAPPVASQSAADRAARKAVVMQIACKLAGAVHSSNVLVNVVQ